jgi:phosphate/sulfate permease
VFFLAALFCGNAIDNILNYIFHKIEDKLNVNKTANWWILMQIIIQLILISILAFVIRLLVVGILSAYVGHTHSINDIANLSMIYSTFISIFPQDHLISNLKKINTLMDR